MAYFKNTEHLYKVMRRLFKRVNQEEVIVDKLIDSDLIVKFTFKEPEGEITVNLQKKPISYHIGPSESKHHVEFKLSADTAHLFWMGKINIPMAIATRKIIARGSGSKALSLLPAIKPVFSIYPEVLKDMGEEKLLQGDGLTISIKKKIKKRFYQKKKDDFKILIQELSDHKIPLVLEESIKNFTIIPQKLPETENELKKEMLKRMILIRAFEEKLKKEFDAGSIPSEALHLSIGQEACAVGACFALSENDTMTTTHRCHGHMIAKGSDIKSITSEIFGKENGLCRGLGGPMHVTDATKGALGANGIVGASTLIALGAALSSQMKKTNQVAFAFMGDGATAQGMFHEAVNFAAVFKLPVIFFVENNQFAEFTPLEGHSAVKKISDRALAYEIPGITIDGNDIWEVYQKVKRATEIARSGGGPTLIEALTYRCCGHTEGETADYRTENEINDWKKKDPIDAWKEILLQSDVITRAEIKELERDTQSLIDEAFHNTQKEKELTLEKALSYLYSPEPSWLYGTLPKAEKTDRELSVSAAIREALKEELSRDESVYLIGEDVRTGGYFAVTAGLVDAFGEKRIIDTPISENAIIGSSVGAAMTGMRPIAEIQFSDFMTCCMDMIVNQAAKLRFMSGGQYQIPMVIRTPGGGGIGMGSQHSQSLESWLLHIPGLIIIAPGDPYDAKGLLKAAVRSNNPVLFFENKLLYALTSPVPEEEYIIPLGKGDIKREGKDVTLVAVGATVHLALEASYELGWEGIDVELIDPRTLFPCDWDMIIRSVIKTKRLAVLESGVLTCGFGAEVAARISTAAWKSLKAPVKRIAGLEMPIPYNRNLENLIAPDIERIIREIESMF